MKALHLALAREVERHAQRLVPVRTGKLKSSIRSSGTVRDAIGRAGSKAVPYAAAVHWGHGERNLAVRRHGTQSRHGGRKASRANPFLRFAAQMVEGDITDRYDQAVHRMLNRVIKDTVG